jgi:membrane-bound lytic murein transglycosylase B
MPVEYERYARAASACPGLDPLILVAIHDVESGRNDRGNTSSAGAVGPMQFLPETWAAYGVDADHDGTADPEDLTDALMGATNLLCANGVTQEATHETAVWNYNHSWTYVRTVLARAADLHRALGI